MGKYTLRELMAIVAARQIKDGEIVFCGLCLRTMGLLTDGISILETYPKLLFT